MDAKFGHALCMIFLVLTIVQKNECSIFDSVPAVQPTMEIANGNPGTGGDIWQKFKEFAVTVVKSEPNVGHEITINHYGAGSREFDNLIIKDTPSLIRPRPEPDIVLTRPSSPHGETSTERSKLDDGNLLRQPDHESIRQVSPRPNMFNCTYCTLGRLDLDRIIYLVNRVDIDRPNMEVYIQEIGTIFKRAGYERVSIKPFQAVGQPNLYTPLRQHPIGTMLQNSLERGQSVKYGLGYTNSRGAHVVLLMAWKNSQGIIQSRLIDFQKPKDVNGRSVDVENDIPSGKTFLIHLGDEAGGRSGGNSDSSSRVSRFGYSNGWFNLTAGRGRSFTTIQNAIVKIPKTTTLPGVSTQHGGWIGMPVESVVGKNLCGHQGQRCRFHNDCCSGYLCFTQEHYEHAWTCFASLFNEEKEITPLNAVCGNEGQRCRSDGDCCSNLCLDSDDYTIPWTCLGLKNRTEENLGFLWNQKSVHLRSMIVDDHLPITQNTETVTTTLAPKVSINNGGWIGMSVANRVEKYLCGTEGQRCRFNKDCCRGNLCFVTLRSRYEGSAWTCFDRSSLSSEENEKTALNALCGKPGQRCRSGGDCCSNNCFDSDDLSSPWTCSG